MFAVKWRVSRHYDDMNMKKCVVFTLFILFVPVAGLYAQKRGMGNPNADFIEKGTFSAGISLGWDSWGANDDDGVDLFGVIEGFEGSVSQSSVSATGAWFFRDNVSVGVNVGYSDTRVQVDSIVFLGAEKVNLNEMRQALEGAVTCRGYLPLFDGNVIALFVEGRLSGRVGYSKHFRNTDNGKEGTYGDLYRLSVGAYTGVSVFATEKVSFEVSLPLLEGGCNWQNQSGTTNDGSTLSHGFVRFKPLITGLRMGMIYHF